MAGPRTIKFERRITNGSGSFRIVIPPEISKAINLKSGDTMEMWMEGDKIVIAKK